MDRIIDVIRDDAVATTRKLAIEEGVFAEMSSGGAMLAALQIASEEKDAVIVSFVCDRGDRYLMSDLF